MLRREMRYGSTVIPAVLVATTVDARVDEMLHAMGEALVDHGFALCGFVSGAHALGQLDGEDAPDGFTGGFLGGVEEGGDVIEGAFDEFDGWGGGGELLSSGGRGRACHCEDGARWRGEGEEGADGRTALAACGAGYEDGAGHS